MRQILCFTIICCGLSSGYAQQLAQVPKAGAGTSEAAPEVSNLDIKPFYLMCKNNNVVRTIRIEKKGRNCKTTYTKDGVDNIVGQSGSEVLCRDVFDKIQENLQKASWKCKDITRSRVSFSTLDH